MKNFVQLRTEAGLGDRAAFLRATGLSDRTLTAYDNDEEVSALQSAVTLAREDYLQGRRALSEERLIMEKTLV